MKIYMVMFVTAAVVWLMVVWLIVRAMAWATRGGDEQQACDEQKDAA